MIPGSDNDQDIEGGLSDNAGEGDEREQMNKARKIDPKLQVEKHQYFGGGSKAKGTSVGSSLQIWTFIKVINNIFQCQVISLAKIVPTTSVSTFVTPTASSQIAAARTFRKKEAIRLSHLPTHLQSGFDTLFGPRLREAFGFTRAWEQPTDAELSRLWSAAFPQERPLDFGTQEGLVVKKLVCHLSFM
jgi:hypothetical protein